MQSRANTFHDGARGSLHLPAWLQNNRVRRFDGQGADLRNRVGTTFENHREEPERATDLFKLEAIIELDAIEHSADRIGQGDHGPNSFDHRFKLLRRELQTIEESFR